MRTLRVKVTPSLTWKSQFETIKGKLINVMTKIMNVHLNHHQILIYYNIYMLTSMYFGYRITILNNKEEAKLIKIYEIPLLKKLGLSIKFP